MTNRRFSLLFLLTRAPFHLSPTFSLVTPNRERRGCVLSKWERQQGDPVAIWPTAALALRRIGLRQKTDCRNEIVDRPGQQNTQCAGTMV